MSSLFSQLQTFFWNIFNRPQLNDLLDILIVAVLIYQMIMLTRDTRASEVLKGFLLLVGASLLSSLLGLTALTWVLKQILSNGALVLVVLFQPEIRRVLEQLGRGAKMEHFQSDGEENQRIISEITQCLTSLSRRRVGALIVFERRTGLKDVMETGTRLDSTISAPLLENIFEPNTPLHDGAVIITEGRIMAAGCMLPLSNNQNISRDLGMRHRAGIGMSEHSDAVVAIVSEETGAISVAIDGMLKRHLTPETFEKILRNDLIIEDKLEDESKPSKLKSVFKRNQKNG